MKAWWFQNKSKTGRFFLTAGLIFLFLVIIALGGYFYYSDQNNLKADHSKESATRFTHLALAELDQNKLPFQENFSIKPVDWVNVDLAQKISLNNSGKKLALNPIGGNLKQLEFTNQE